MIEKYYAKIECDQGIKWRKWRRSIAKDLVICKVELDKNIFELGESINFHYRCSRKDQKDFSLFQDFTYYASANGRGLRVNGSDGKRYELHDYPFLSYPGWGVQDIFNNNSIVATFIYPVKKCCSSNSRFFEDISWEQYRKKSKSKTG